jgi:hypothetical protein
MRALGVGVGDERATRPIHLEYRVLCVPRDQLRGVRGRREEDERGEGGQRDGA